jgi:polyisoprenoid-binding protein YceI
MLRLVVSRLVFILPFFSFQALSGVGPRMASQPTHSPQTTQPTQKSVYKIDLTHSTILWMGKKLANSQHDGSIGIQSGSVTFESNVPKEAEIIIDMTSIKNLDIKDDSKEKLISHLESVDFFDTANHKTSKLTINSFSKTKDNSWKASGQMTIRGVTQPVEFELNVDLQPNSAQASGQLVFDRNLFGINYRSKKSWFDTTKGAVLDKVISDDIEIKFKIVAAP